jgi:hypothetical protein
VPARPYLLPASRGGGAAGCIRAADQKCSIVVVTFVLRAQASTDLYYLLKKQKQASPGAGLTDALQHAPARSQRARNRCDSTRVI